MLIFIQNAITHIGNHCTTQLIITAPLSLIKENKRPIVYKVE